MPETCCCVPNCSNRGGHVFPSDPLRRKTWIHAIKRGETRFQSWTPSTHAVVCRAHFKSDDYLTETQHGNYFFYHLEIFLIYIVHKYQVMFIDSIFV